MRKLALLTLFAAAALFFSAPENAFAHSNHNHVQQTQSGPVLNGDATAHAAEHIDEFVSAAYPQTDTCPHGQGADCGFCCVCACGASVALTTQEVASGTYHAESASADLAVLYEIRQAVLDLSRPPKSFA
jgi:hypothetical protein